jgi:glycosyltransferase involved in cell wall biosynthesis
VLIIAYEFPPAAGGGVSRLTAFTKYLRRCGWEPVVLTGVPGAGRPRDEALLAEIQGVEVIRIPSRNPVWTLARLARPLKALVRRSRRPPTASGASAGGPAAPSSPVTTRLARRFAFPDEAAWWARHVVRIAPSICRRRAVEVVLASGPPFSALAAAIEVGESLRLPVVLDMRDQWRDNVGLRWPTPAHKRRSDDLERRTLARAAAVVGATDGIVAEAVEMGARSAETIYNGFDPDRMVQYQPEVASPLRIAFLGRFSRDVMDPTPFMQAFADALDREPAVAGARLDVIGPESPWVSELAEGLGIADSITFHGFLPYHQALELVARADVGLMCVADRPGSRELFPGKLFDYLGIGVPLLFVGPTDGGVARLIVEGGLGSAVGHNDVSSIAAAIGRLARAKAAGQALATPDPAVAARFDRQAQVGCLSRLLERAVAAS